MWRFIWWPRMGNINRVNKDRFINRLQLCIGTIWEKKTILDKFHEWQPQARLRGVPAILCAKISLKIFFEKVCKKHVFVIGAFYFIKSDQGSHVFHCLDFVKVYLHYVDSLQSEESKH